jgi:hypothetical protein
MGNPPEKFAIAKNAFNRDNRRALTELINYSIQLKAAGFNI